MKDLQSPDYSAYIQYILNNFNFKNVCRSMKLLGWKWHNASTGCLEHPSVDHLYETAKDLLTSLAESPSDVDFIATGGFYAIRVGEGLVLHFSIEEGFMDFDDPEVIALLDSLPESEEPRPERVPIRSGVHHMDV